MAASSGRGVRMADLGVCTDRWHWVWKTGLAGWCASQREFVQCDSEILNPIEHDGGHGRLPTSPALCMWSPLTLPETVNQPAGAVMQWQTRAGLSRLACPCTAALPQILRGVQLAVHTECTLVGHRRHPGQGHRGAPRDTMGAGYPFPSLTHAAYSTCAPAPDSSSFPHAPVWC